MDAILLISLVLVPLAMWSIDVFAGHRGGKHNFEFGASANEDFTILVPIYGKAEYLENVDYLSVYGRKVMLCTTGGESELFYTQLNSIAQAHGFRLFRSEWGPKQHTSKRATSGTVRDRLIRDALQHVGTGYSIPLDADSTSAVHLSVAVGELAARRGDIASVRLVPGNSDSLLARLQQYEYRLAMNFRYVSPWLISGACHIAKTSVLRDIMDRHSLFFQGNDVETGLIAKHLGYKVIHIPFEIFTTVPSAFKPWFRQRLAWAGGEFRLFVMNFRFGLHHPFFWVYGGIVTIGLFPLRWEAVAIHNLALFEVMALYAVLIIYLHWEHRARSLLFMPAYTLLLNLVFTPMGAFWYFWMAYKDKNLGIIRPERAPENVV